MRPDSGQVNNNSRKILDAPINLGEMAANLENEVDTMRSIWVIQRDESLVSTLMKQIIRMTTKQFNCL